MSTKRKREEPAYKVRLTVEYEDTGDSCLEQIMTLVHERKGRLVVFSRAMVSSKLPDICLDPADPGGL